MRKEGEAKNVWVIDSHPRTGLLMRLVYLDTNVYNALADRLTHAEVTRLPDVLDRLGIGVSISPINILEILTQRETTRKEQLVWVAQHIAAPPLLPEPESIIIDYAARVVKDHRVERLRLCRPTARAPLRDEWENVYADKRRTLSISQENVQAIVMMKKLNALHHAVASRGALETSARNFDLRGVPGDHLLSALADATARTRSIELPSDRSAFYQQNVVLLTAAILCVGVTPFPEPIDEFWTLLELHTVEDRLNFIWEEHPDLYLGGAMVGLFNLAWWQSKRAYNRGNLFDGYHLQYLQMIPEFLTNDSALLEYGAGRPPGSRLRENLQPAHDFLETVVAAIRA